MRVSSDNAQRRRSANLPKTPSPFVRVYSKRCHNVIVLPVLEDHVKVQYELASLNTFTASHLVFLEQLTASIGIVLNSIEATID